MPAFTTETTAKVIDFAQLQPRPPGALDEVGRTGARPSQNHGGS